MLIQCLVFESSDGGAQSYESRRQAFALCTKLLVGVVSLSIFGGNFVLAKVHLGFISVHCSELRGVRFSEVRNLLVLGKINRGQVICPLFGGSVITGFTVYIESIV